METISGTELDGRYRLTERIGSGGAATVYRAFDCVLEREVAVKVRHRNLAVGSEELHRFAQEARAVAALSHPNIVSVIDTGEDEQCQYIVFEYVEGKTLKEHIAESGSLPIDESVAIAIEISQALGAAHSRGIIHRDIKPQNVLLDREGHIKVGDFGLACSGTELEGSSESGIFGTTNYISPEQAQNGAVSKETDIYSLGIVLFEMLTGSVPFPAESAVAAAMKHIREPLPEIQRLRPEVSATLAAVLDRMTAKDPADRYPSATTLRIDLQDALTVETARAGRASSGAAEALDALPQRQRRRIPLRVRSRIPAAAALLVLLLIAVGLFFIIKAGVTGEESESTQAGISRQSKAIAVKSLAAADYDPLGDGKEHPDQAAFTIDNNPNTKWTTDRYFDGKLPKKGVGIYIEAIPRAVVSELEIQTPKPGWEASIYTASAGPPTTMPSDGWKLMGKGRVEQETQRFKLATSGRPYRYFLVWITALPENEKRVEISQISLLRPKQT